MIPVRDFALLDLDHSHLFCPRHFESTQNGPELSLRAVLHLSPRGTWDEE